MRAADNATKCREAADFGARDVQQRVKQEVVDEEREKKDILPGRK